MNDTVNESTEEPLKGSVHSDEQPEKEKEWWDDPGMPWRHKPGKADITCMTCIGIMGLISVILLPLRAWLLGLSPGVLAMMTGGRTAVAASGALAEVGQLPWWPGVLAVSSILSLKFDWIFWWAGKLWGRGIIEVWAGGSKRAGKRFARAEKWANKLGTAGMFVAYVPFPLPLQQVVFVLFGAAKMPLRRFLILDYIASTLWLGLYFWLGWSIGETAVSWLEAYAKISAYIAYGLIAFVIITAIFKPKRKKVTPPT